MRSLSVPLLKPAPSTNAIDYMAPNLVHLKSLILNLKMQKFSLSSVITKQ